MANEKTPAERFAVAQAAVHDAERRNLSISTLNKRWREYFRAEDALKASGVAGTPWT